MKKYLPILAWLFALPASAQLLDGLTGYYSFESQTGGVAPNAGRELGSAGFTNDGARLLGGDPIGGGGSTVPLSTVAGTFRAGTGALACDGAGDYARLDVTPVNVQLDYTVALWFKPDTGGAGAPASRSFVIETKPGFVISFGLRPGVAGVSTNFQLFTDAGTDPNASFNVPNAEVDQWHHLVIRYVAGSQSVQGYIDGVQRYNLAFTGSPGAATGINTGTYRSANDRWYKGFIDEEIFWQRALDLEEIVALYEAGGAGKSFAALSAESEQAALRTNLTAYYDFDSETNREVANKAVALGAPGYPGDVAVLVGDYSAGVVPTVPPITNDPAQARSGNGALLCDGINNYASIPGNPVDITQDFSVSVWFKPDTGGAGYGTAATRGFIYESGGTDSYSISFGLRGGTVSGTTNFQLFTLQASVAQSRDYSVANEQLDQWHHYLETYEVSTGTIVGYLDGVETHRITGLTPLHAYVGLNLGTYRGADARWFKGLIDEVAFWQRTLPIEEVLQIYQAGTEGVSLPDTASGGTGNTGLAVTGFAKLTPGPGYRITWRSVPGLKYTLEASGDLIDWSTELVSDYVAPGASVTFDIVPDFPAPEGALYDPALGESPSRFYRVKRKN